MFRMSIKKKKIEFLTLNANNQPIILPHTLKPQNIIFILKNESTEN
jgi:hypothetical protein